jgi:hypothetical protein
LSASAGYYTAVSDAEFTGHEKRPLVRFYFDVVPSGGPLLVYILTRGLNDARAWFRLKLLNAPAAYWRSDAAVLYVRSSDLSRARPILAELVCVLEGHIRAPVPAFTKRLALGVAAAEQPRTNESFGQSRCRILAEGIIDAHTEGRRSAGARLEAVEARFGSAGLDLDVPYLESGSIDRLHL